MMDFLPDKIIMPDKINEKRVFKLLDKPISSGDIVYMPTRELRLFDNWAVIFGLELAEKYKKNFKIIIIKSEINHSNRQTKLVNYGIDVLKQDCAKNKIDFTISDTFTEKIGALIVDFNPIISFRPPIGRAEEYPIFEVDSHNIIPARFVSDKQEYGAATLRRKTYANIAEFFTEYPVKTNVKQVIASRFMLQDESNDVAKQSFQTLQDRLLNDFIQTKLEDYAEFKNIPQNDVTSHLSPYLAFGLISSQRVALEVLKSGASRPNIEAFLEELIVRKELADNFCLYAKSFNTLESIPNWAKDTLNAHRQDIRTYLYSKEEFEHGKTHDKLWNEIQKGLVKKGEIHGYLRMYWAKKILEWSKSPEEALEILIYLNDTYALDGNNPNGYVGILWSIGGLHDRAFTNRFVSGKIRYMKG